MTAYPVGDFQPANNRPGMRVRNLIATEHGVTSFYVSEMVMEQDAAIPLHTHLVEEAFLIAEGSLELRLGDQVVVAEAESVVSIPAGVPHAVRNAGPSPARAIAAAAWNRETWFKDATTFPEGVPRED